MLPTENPGGSPPMSYARSVPAPKKVEVFDDFRPYKLCALKALNNAVFNLEKSFVPLVVCTNIHNLTANMNVHNGQYKIIKDLAFINKLLDSNGGFNFSLLSFDVSQFILPPGYYVKNVTGPFTPPAPIPAFSYTHEVYNPFAPFGSVPRGQTPPPPVSYDVVETTPDCGAILIFLEV